MKRLRLWLGILLIGFYHTASSAETIRTGSPLPALTIDDKGELVIKGEEVEFKPWSTTDLQGKVVYLQYMAGRRSADKMNSHVNDALEDEGFPQGSFSSTVLVNLDDVTFGASGFALKEMKKNKLKHPNAHLIADSEGKGLKTWGLKEEHSAIGIIGKSGEVLFFKEGALNEEEVAKILALLWDQINN